LDLVGPWLVSPQASADKLLRVMHEAFPVAQCPFSWSAQGRLAVARREAAAGRLNHDCAPNTILADDGRWSGHVDLGALGTADRWADLAVATWSAGWNYGPGWGQVLLDGYGIQPDPERIRYYRLLWDLS
jgi:kanamycin kinase